MRENRRLWREQNVHGGRQEVTGVRLGCNGDDVDEVMTDPIEGERRRPKAEEIEQFRQLAVEG